MGTDFNFSDISISTIREKDAKLADIAESVDKAGKNHDGKINVGLEFVDFYVKAQQQGYSDAKFYELIGLDIKNKDKIDIQNLNAAQDEMLADLKKDEIALLEKKETELQKEKETLEKEFHKPAHVDLYDVQQESLLNKLQVQLFSMIDTIRRNWLSAKNNNQKWSQEMRAQFENYKQESLQKLEEVEQQYEIQKTQIETKQNFDKEKMVETEKKFTKSFMSKEIQAMLKNEF